MNLREKGPPCVGIDLGGTNMSAAVVDSHNRVIGSSRRKTYAELGFEAVLERVAEMVATTIKEAGLKKKKIRAIGIGVPSPVVIETGIALDAPNLGWRRVDVGSRLAERTGLPVFVDNDVNVAVYGEFRTGAAKEFDDVLGIWSGTGVGGGLVLGGRPYYGHHWTAGEIGHTVILPGIGLGRETLEEIASRAAIVRTLVDLIRSNHSSIVPELVDGDLSSIKSKTLAKAARAGDGLTIRVLRDAARFVGIAAANFVTTLSLPCVVLGGGLATELGDMWAEWVGQSVSEHVFPQELKSVSVVVTQLGDDAGTIGGAIIARERATEKGL